MTDHETSAVRQPSERGDARPSRTGAEVPEQGASPAANAAAARLLRTAITARPDTVRSRALQQPQAILALQRTAGNAAVGRLLSRSPATIAATSRPRSSTAVNAAATAPIQRFGSEEHRSLGNVATGSATVNVGGEKGGARFELTHGDVIALSGDFFPPDKLMDLAKLPGNRGQAPGTRDEIIYALYHIKNTDARFQRGGPWAGFTFSDKVKKNVNDRYLNLAAANAAHFPAPRGRDASGQPKPTPKGETGAGQAYRDWHEEAIKLAYEAGAGQGGSLSHAMAMEAAAQHFLTDAFSAGHIRTPIGSIRDYWGSKYPLFWYNLRHKIALDTAIQLNAQDTNAATVLGSVQQMYEKISAQVEAMSSSLPPLTLGDLLAKVFHDYDNEHGLDIQGGGRVFGDSHLDAFTRKLAQDAIKAGNHEITIAFNLGRAEPQLAEAERNARVRQASGAPAGAYAAEALLPRPAATNPDQNWKAPTFEALWDQPVVGRSGPSVGSLVLKAVKPGGEIRHQLDSLAAKFPATEKVKKGPIYLGTVRPRQAYTDGFLTPLVSAPKTGILAILHWTPNYGLSGEDRDDISLATGQELADAKKLKGMTSVARVRYIRELVGGVVGDDEERLVVKIFETAPAAARPGIYKGVEGHDWTGEWIHGIATSDDEIWNALNRGRLRRLKGLINAAGTP